MLSSAGSVVGSAAGNAVEVWQALLMVAMAVRISIPTKTHLTILAWDTALLTIVLVPIRVARMGTVAITIAIVVRPRHGLGSLWNEAGVAC